MELLKVPIDKPDDLNLILGQSHFIKTVEDLHEVLGSWNASSSNYENCPSDLKDGSSTVIPGLLSLEISELLRRSGKAVDAERMRVRAAKAYIRTDNQVGLGRCALLKGDAVAFGRSASHLLGFVAVV